MLWDLGPDAQAAAGKMVNASMSLNHFGLQIG